MVSCRVFSHDVMAAVLMNRNIEIGTQSYRIWIFFYVNTLYILFQYICMVAGDGNENVLLGWDCYLSLKPVMVTNKWWLHGFLCEFWWIFRNILSIWHSKWLSTHTVYQINVSFYWSFWFHHKTIEWPHPAQQKSSNGLDSWSQISKLTWDSTRSVGSLLFVPHCTWSVL